MVKKDKNAVNAKRKKVASKKPVVNPISLNKTNPKMTDFSPVYGKAKSTNKSNKLISFIKKYPIIAFLLPILIIGGGNLAYQRYQERQSFNKAEVLLNQVSSDITAVIGQPISTKTTKSCGYSSAKFSKGTLGCGVGIDIKYKQDPNNPESLKTIDKVKAILSDKKYAGENVYNSVTDFGLGADLTNSWDMNCSVSYAEEKLSDIEVSMGCSKPTSVEYFTVIDK